MMSPDGTTRYQTLDGLRGIAVMGILLMNIGAIALPVEAYLHPPLGIRHAADLIVWAFDFVLVDGKLRSLFAFLFGAGLLLVADRAEAAGGSAAAVHYRRMAWLLLFGMAHLYLLWWGDILHHYALVGSIAFLFRDRPAHALMTLGIVILVLDLVLLGSATASLWSLRAAATAADATPDLVRAWRDTALAAPPAPRAIATEIALYLGDYAGIVRHRLTAQRDLPLLELLTSGPETFALMLFGMAALRSGFVTGAWSRGAYRRVAMLAYAIGLPPMLALAIWCVRSGFDPLVTQGASMVLALPFRPVLMAGHAALLIMWFAQEGGWVRARIAAAGRMALSNYLLTSLVMTSLFYGYGGGAFGRWGNTALLVPVALMWAAMLLWSRPWLDRFAYGPFEYAWRSLARWRIESLRC